MADYQFLVNIFNRIDTLAKLDHFVGLLTPYREIVQLHVDVLVLVWLSYGVLDLLFLLTIVAPEEKFAGVTLRTCHECLLVFEPAQSANFH